ncbi:hypothetical protein G6F50_014545 [Rhizopus delemar]|uniref:Uncharacterized protein n=1 Tax=Rhizopus delemar TaxID=936053 RepID=A0A9P6Y4J3_9FUNG|nr:hypothetical protein G6F50_014545 [Rhizopus delemar]
MALGRRHQLVGDGGEQPAGGCQQCNHDADVDGLVPQDPADLAAVPARQPLDRACGAAEFGMVMGKVLAQQRNQGNTDDQRQQQRDSHHDAQTAQVLACFRAGDGKRHERQDDRQRRNQKRHEHRAAGVSGSLVRRLTQREPPLHVLSNDNRVIDEQSQGDDDGTHRDHVQIDVQDLHDRHRSQYRGRHDGADDQAGPHSKE